ncbi:hypothetical protein [Frigoribacterium sp. CFBP 13707]|uniref:hypothetical protein n=1 Tax=Frigoribacterium sp. CFBP 13707 TaxID=2775313 RepID=UPI001782D162|nr:hypothetical protein [Frigoribacterium sp. CFBP 13707]MBD8727448.1 hypothetical protein [Frigoribacterium sp. CFBP 13707]
MKKIIAAALLVVAGVFAGPAAAQAYVPSTNVTVQGTVAAGGTINVTIVNGSFIAGENVSFAVTGEGRVTLAAIETTTLVKTADANGAARVAVTLPTTARGSYALTATGLTSGNVATAALTVVAADGTPAAGSNNAGGLAFTGSTVPTLVIWAAAGALMLGIALMVVVTLQRRARNNA